VDRLSWYVSCGQTKTNRAGYGHSVAQASGKHQLFMEATHPGQLLHEQQQGYSSYLFQQQMMDQHGGQGQWETSGEATGGGGGMVSAPSSFLHIIEKPASDSVHGLCVCIFLFEPLSFGTRRGEGDPALEGWTWLMLSRHGYCIGVVLLQYSGGQDGGEEERLMDGSGRPTSPAFPPLIAARSAPLMSDYASHNGNGAPAWYVDMTPSSTRPFPRRAHNNPDETSCPHSLST